MHTVTPGDALEPSGTPHTGGGNRRGRRATFGSIRKLASGNYQARYTGPDVTEHRAPVTFQTIGDARAWLSLRQASIVKAEWTPETERKNKPKPITFGVYSASWLAARPLKPRTRSGYQSLLRDHIGPTFDDVALREITPPAVRGWHSTMPNKPTTKAHAYALLKAIMKTAVDDDLVTANPCRVRGAGQAKRAKKIQPASLDELAVIVATIPARYKAMVLIAAWCGLRFGEITELRRSDFAAKAGVLKVRRGVVRAERQVIVGDPKSAAGSRDVAIPPHLLDVLKEHLREHAQFGRDGLIFPAADGVSHMAPATLYKVFYRARAAAGRPDLRWHDLRHTGAVLAASTGATLAELMARLGHSTPGAALRYQHAAEGRDAIIAAKLSALVTGATR